MLEKTFSENILEQRTSSRLKVTLLNTIDVVSYSLGEAELQSTVYKDLISSPLRSAEKAPQSATAL